MYDDEIDTVVDHFLDGRHVIHSELKAAPTPATLKHAYEVSKEIDRAYADHGIDKLYTWGSTSEHDRYNRFLGYQPTAEVFTAPDSIKYRVYEKDLNL